MGAPFNLSFEEAGAQPGTAAGWALVAVSTYEVLADFGGAAWETFERGWGNDTHLFAFEPADLAHADFDTIIVDAVKLVEDFEELWQGNESYLTSLDSPEPESALFDEGVWEAERFEWGWDENEGWKSAFTGVGVDLTRGDFDPGTGGQQDETFTTWAPGYTTSFAGVGVDLAAATFRDGADAFEAFEYEQAPRLFSVNTATSTLTLVGTNPFMNADKVNVVAEGSYPAPLQASQTYYVRDQTGPTCKLTLSPGGVALTITGTPSGAVYLTGDPVLYWTEKMVTTAF